MLAEPSDGSDEYVTYVLDVIYPWWVPAAILLTVGVMLYVR